MKDTLVVALLLDFLLLHVLLEGEAELVDLEIELVVLLRGVRGVLRGG